jgi:nicotinamidase/pyrazinamidase
MPIKTEQQDALLVIDVQNDFCAGGALAVRGGDEVVPVINRIAPLFPHVLMTQDWHPMHHLSFASSHAGRPPFEVVDVAYGKQTLWPDHCVQGSRGAEFHKDLRLSAELILRKGFRPEIDSYSAFQENDRATKTGLAGYLRERGIQRLFLCGLAYDYCVRYSAVDARAAGFDAIVIEDACRAIDLERSVETARKDFSKCGVELVDSDEIEA